MLSESNLNTICAFIESKEASLFIQEINKQNKQNKQNYKNDTSSLEKPYENCNKNECVDTVNINRPSFTKQKNTLDRKINITKIHERNNLYRFKYSSPSPIKHNQQSKKNVGNKITIRKWSGN